MYPRHVPQGYVDVKHLCSPDRTHGRRRHHAGWATRTCSSTSSSVTRVRPVRLAAHPGADRVVAPRP